jgi:Cu-Zn family superoxide dismutase
MLKRRIPWAVVAIATLVVALAGCGGEKPAEETAESPELGAKSTVNEAVAALEPKSGSEVTGQGVFTLEGDKVTLYLSLQNLPPGVHAVHIHQFGDCSAEDGSSAGGHWNPLEMNHGKWNEAPFHLGDLGNVEADEYGNGSLTLTTSMWTIASGAADDVVGKSIVVHESEDDFTTQPTGAAGGRIACGVIAIP